MNDDRTENGGQPAPDAAADPAADAAKGAPEEAARDAAKEAPAPADGAKDAGAKDAAKETPARPPRPARTLVEDAEAGDAPADGADGGRKDGADGGGPAAPSQEEVDAFVRGIPSLDLGDGAQWDDATLRAMAPALMEVAGGDPKRADGVVRAYAGFVQERARLAQEAEDAFNDGLVRECGRRFGDDLRKVAAYAARGGRAVFGDALWDEMKGVPQFANNPDIMERLAEIGRRATPDGGAASPPGGRQPEAGGDVLHRMYGGLRV